MCFPCSNPGELTYGSVANEIESSGYLWNEDLILTIAIENSIFFHNVKGLLCFRPSAGERFLAYDVFMIFRRSYDRLE
jgi:hypothetical protein